MPASSAPVPAVATRGPRLCAGIGSHHRDRPRPRADRAAAPPRARRTRPRHPERARPRLARPPRHARRRRPRAPGRGHRARRRGPARASGGSKRTRASTIWRPRSARSPRTADGCPRTMALGRDWRGPVSRTAGRGHPRGEPRHGGDARRTRGGQGSARVVRGRNALVHPTLYEGSSLVTLEAMAHRRAVVAANAGGLPDKVKPGVNGWLVEPGTGRRSRRRSAVRSTNRKARRVRAGRTENRRGRVLVGCGGTGYAGALQRAPGVSRRRVQEPSPPSPPSAQSQSDDSAGSAISAVKGSWRPTESRNPPRRSSSLPSARS